MFDMRMFEEQKSGLMPTWKESALRDMLEYQTASAFRRVIRKAMQTCLAIDRDPAEHFRLVDGEYELNRAACYLVCMSADSRKKAVAKAQGYLAAIVDLVQDRQIHAESVDRIVLREDMKDGMKSLVFTAKNHGVENFAAFLDAGYLGMYNMSLQELTVYKGLNVRDRLIDHMGRVELAANHLRVTMTEETINKNNIRGQARLENASFRVGGVVRQALIDGTGVAPENIRVSTHINEAKRLVKSAEKRLGQLTSEEVDFYIKDEHELLAAGEDPGYIPDPEEDPLPEEAEDDWDDEDDDSDSDSDDKNL